MKYLLSTLILAFLISCNSGDGSYVTVRSKKLKNNVIKYILVENYYSPGDTIEWREYRDDSLELYLILDDNPILKK